MSAENVEIVRRVVESFNDTAFDAVAFDLFDPEVELSEWPEGPDPRTFHGRDGVLRAQESWAEAWGRQRIEPREFVDVGDRVVVHLHHRARGRGSDIEVELDSFNVFTLRDGLIVRMELFAGREAALTAAGISEHEAIVRRLFDAFNRLDIDAALAACDPAIELHSWSEGPDRQTYRGHGGMRAALDTWLESWEWMRVEITGIVEAGDRVVATLHQRAAGRGSGIEVEITSFSVHTFRDRTVVRIELFTDRELALRAAGLAPDYQEEKR